MKKTILFVVVLLLCNIAMAQVKVTGIVTSSEDGSPIPFANIQVKGVKNIGATTDLDGRYTFEKLSKDAILVFTYIGYTTQEVHVNGRTVVNVALVSDALNLEEVMVVAYGTAKKGSYTGAASVVKADAIKDVPTISFESALNGKVAGMQITTTSGQAGSTSSIRLRGIGSMNATNEPLYVIDGVPVVSGDQGQMGGYIYTSNNVMNSLNPGDIESITVLKDAAASSLYGSRAANGVILVTTKKGKEGRPVVSFKASLGISPSWATDNYEAASTEHQVEMYYENFWNAGVYYKNKTEADASASALAQLNNRFKKHGYIFSASDNTVKTLKIEGDRAGKYYDWNKDLFRTAVFQNYDMSVSGATDKSNYYSSLSYTKELGRSVINDYDRITARLNVAQKVNKFIEFATNINIAKSTKTGYNDTRSTGSNYFLQSRNLLWGLYWPTDYLTGADWTARYGSYAYNPLYYNKQWENSSKMLKLSANEAVTINIKPELVFKSVLSFDNTQTRDHLYYSALHFNGAADNGSVTEMSTNANKVVTSSTFSYNKTFADEHTLGILIGWEAEKNKTDFQRSTGTNLSTSTLHSVATAGKMDANAYYWGNTMLSALSRIEYNYLSRYFFSASFRRDGSSKLSVNSRWGNFWSVAASWKLNSEKFMADMDYISNLKIRASYGGNGTLPQDNYGYITQTTYSNSYMQNPGGGVLTIADPNLQWETNYTTNIAVEFGLFDQRLSGSIEYYNRNSKNLLQNVPISLVTGIDHTLKNVGEINNHGVEIEINGDIIRSKTLTWSAGITASSIKSSVNKLYGGQDIIWKDPTGSDGRAQYIYREGKSTLALYGLEWAGVDDETGKNVWYLNNDQTADLTVNGRPATFSYSKASETVIGNIHPKLFGGINTDVKWNNFNAGLNFTYKIGGYTYDGAGKDVADDGYYWERIMSEYQYKNRWTPENKTASLPMRAAIDMEDVNQMSSRHMHKADYLRLKNIMVGYNLPKNIISKMNVSNVRVYFNGSNLWTWAAFDLYDPEVNEYGTRGWETPISKTYTFGVEFTF